MLFLLQVLWGQYVAVRGCGSEPGVEGSESHQQQQQEDHDDGGPEQRCPRFLVLGDEVAVVSRLRRRREGGRGHRCEQRQRIVLHFFILFSALTPKKEITAPRARVSVGWCTAFLLPEV